MTGSLDKLPYKAKICRLGTDRSGFTGPDQGLFLNLMEQFFALIFQSLQSKDLMAWLPREIPITAGHGLNVALPIHQGHRDVSYMAVQTNQLLHSKDPVNQEYARGKVVQRIEDLPEDGQTHWASAPNKARGFGKYCEVFREASLGDLNSIRVKCNGCQWQRTDSNPVFLVVSNMYVARSSPCVQCHGRHNFVPVDPELGFINFGTVVARIEKHTSWALYYIGEGPRPAELESAAKSEAVRAMGREANRADGFKTQTKVQ